MIWFVEDQARYEREQEALSQLEEEAEWLNVEDWRIDESQLKVDFSICIGGRVRVLVLTYGTSFPFSAPSVATLGGERLSEHQYVDGELCLEYGADNWHSDLTGAHMVRSAEVLLRSEEAEPNPVPSRHHLSEGQELRGKFCRGVVSTEFLQALASRAGQTGIKTRFCGAIHEESFVAVPEELQWGDETTWRDPKVPRVLRSESRSFDGVSFEAPPDVDFDTCQSSEEMKAAVKSCGLEFPEGYSPSAHEFVLLVQNGCPHLYWLGRDDKLIRCGVVVTGHEERLRFHRSELAKRKVGVVGCGSLGGKVATMLARSGVEQFLLVDDDILLPGNLVRNELSWLDVGEHKVDALSRRLSLVAPGASCTVRRQRLGGQESNVVTDKSLGLLSGCDLLIDASANPCVFNLLAECAVRQKIPVFWAEVFGGGFGGFMARSRPGLDPTPQTARARIEGWCEERGVLPPRAPDAYTNETETLPQIAGDADVSIVAGRMAQFVLDHLTRQEGEGQYPSSAYMFSFTRGWIFEQPFEAHPINIGMADDWDVQRKPPTRDHIERIVRMMSRTENEATDQS